MDSIYFHPKIKLGILGGGQLGRMMIPAILQLDIDAFFLDPDPNAPCTILGEKCILGDYKDFDTVYKFGKNLDVITIEIEQVNVDALKELRKKDVKIFPQPEVIELIQSKIAQKQFYADNNIPTAPYKVINSFEELKECLTISPCTYVYKSAFAGYDGKGVWKINTLEDIESVDIYPGILEEKIDFYAEISVIVCRRNSEDRVAYETIQMVADQDLNLLKYLISPIELPFDNIENKAKKLAIDISEKLDIVGLLAVEMFVTQQGEILINEVAPRPHNSGHHTIEHTITSQFDNLIRAIVNLPLGNVDTQLSASTVNLLGKHVNVINHNPNFYEFLDSNSFLHLYGKDPISPNRKVGHITFISAKDDVANTSAKTKAEQITDFFNLEFDKYEFK
jgi:5-(carboxyamino)imidazole ribonucleotide synthase